MPYSSTSEVRDGLTPEEQRQWMAVFNDVIENASEERAFEAAWSAVESAELVEVPEKYADIDLVPPEAAQDNARKALRWKDEHPDEIEGGTQVGWTRANQLADGGELTPDVIRRMAAFERHRKNSDLDSEYDGEPWKDAGYVAWLIWGGDEGVDWAQRKSDELDRADEAAENAEATDLGEQHRRWVPAFAVDQITKHPAGDFETDADFWSAIKYGFSVLKDGGYYPPILQQHESDGLGKGPRTEEDGFVYGKVIDMAKRDGRYMWQIEAPEAMLEAIDEGWIENWSPSFYPKGWEHPHTGEKLDAAPRHLAFVSVPHQKNLGPGSPFYSLHELQEAMMADESPENEEPTDNIDDEKDMQEFMDDQREMMEGMAQTVAKIEQMLSALVPDADEGETGETENAEVDALKTELAEAREQLKAERTKRYEARVKSVKPDVEDTELAEIIELAETDPDAYAGRLLELNETRTAGSNRQSEIGSQGNAPSSESKKDKFDAKIRELEEQGVYGAEAIVRAREETGITEYEVN